MDEYLKNSLFRANFDSMLVLSLPQTETVIYLHDSQVKWDDDTKCNHENRVSPWDVKGISSSVSMNHCLSSSVSKRTKLCFPQRELDAPILGRFHNMKMMQVHSRKFYLTMSI
jgi:hypothetical protein